MRKTKKRRSAARTKRAFGIDYDNAEIRREVLVEQRKQMWTSEQIASLAKHFRLRPGMKLLDAGCGYGYSMRAYGPYCMPRGRLVGVDIKEKHLKEAGRLVAKEGLARRAAFVKGSVYELPFDCNTFDITIAQVVLCHLAEPQRALDEFIRVTRAGGCIAVFDNAHAGGATCAWTNTLKPTIKQELLHYEAAMYAMKGKTKVGDGDWAVGCYVPGWMEERGLRDVDARQNERVRWIAPPYRSPAQKTTLRGIRERCRRSALQSAMRKESVALMRVAGADEELIRRALRSSGRRLREFREAVREGTAAFASSGPFWCIWGFKPKGRSTRRRPR